MDKPRPRRGRTLLRRSAVILVLLAVTAAVGALYESATEARDARDYPPPGRLVNVGVYRLPINCAGSGSPTVIIEAGLGDWSTGWG